VAWNLLLGDDDQAGFLADVAAVMVGEDPGQHLRQAALMMGVSGWLEVVLSWPRRFIMAEAAEFAGLEAEFAGLEADEPGP
jgi:hypothetical protein